MKEGNSFVSCFVFVFLLLLGYSWRDLWHFTALFVPFHRVIHAILRHNLCEIVFSFLSIESMLYIIRWEDKMQSAPHLL